MSEFKNKTEKELMTMLSEKRKALQTFYFNITASKTKNVKEGRGIRKTIAQIMTEIKAKK